MTTRPDGAPRFAAVIAHADEAALLRRCIEHHLAIGVADIFVSLNWDDAESRAAVAAFADRGVRGEAVPDYTDDEFDYFTGAKRRATELFDPDWMLFIDSDEFWLPAAGRIAATAHLAATDCYVVERFNVPPVRRRDGSVAPPRLDDLRACPILARPVPTSTDDLTAHADDAWIHARIVPKIMVRPHCARTILQGAHGIVPPADAARTRRADDLLIVHVPFTTESRFRAKVDGIRDRMTRLGSRYGTGEAWHWRRWLAVDDAGATRAEFEAQALDESHIATLLADGFLTTPDRLFAERRLFAHE